MLDWISGSRVDCVCIFLPVLYIEFSVVSGSDNPARAPVGFPYSVYLGSGRVVSVLRLVNSDAPVLPFRVHALAEDFANVHQHVLHSDRVQVSGYDIACVSLGYSIEIKSLAFLALFHCLCNFLWRRRSFICEAEAPDIEERSALDVECAVCHYIVLL